MARYWVAGTGSWSDQAHHWASTSGGAPAAGTPTAADDVIFDANSGTGTVTINASAVCRSFTTTGSTLAFASGGAFNLTVGDSLGGAFTLGSTMGSISSINGLVLNSSSSNGGTGWAITTAGKALPNTVFSSGGKWVFQDSWTSGANITHNAGTLDTNGQAVSLAKFVSNTTSTRTITLGATAMTLSTGALGLDFSTTTGMTFNAGTSTITFTGASATPNTGGKTFNNLVFTGGGSASISGGIVANNVTVTGTAVKTDNFAVGSMTVSGTLTMTGNSVTNRLNWTATGSVQQSASCAAVSLTNVDIVDRGLTGAAINSGGTSLGDQGNNAGITFTAPQTNYWVGNGGNYSDSAAHWASSSGGTAGTGRVPLPQDTAMFDSNSFSTSAQTVTLDMARLGKDFTWNVTNSPTFSLTANASIHGSVSLTGLRATAGWSGTMTLAGRGTHSLTTNNLSWSTTAISALTGTYTFGSDFTDVASLNFNSGSINTSNYTIACTALNSATTNTRSLTFGSSVVNLTGTGTVLNFTGTPTISAANATFNVTDTSATAKSLSLLGGTYGALNYANAGTGSLTVTHTGATVTTLAVSGAAKTLTLNSGQTLTLSNFNVFGAAGALVTLNASTPGTAATLTKTGGGAITADYLIVQDITGTVATWFVGANSTNVSNNTGLVFAAGPSAATARGFLAMLG